MTNAPPLPPSIAFVLLAAGRGERFGGRKTTALLGDIPLWRHAASAADAAGFSNRIVVMREEGAFGPLDEWNACINADANAGIASTIRAGIAAAGEAERIVFALADMPFVEPAHLRALAIGDGVIFTAQADGGKGIPAAFPRASFARLCQLSGDRGAGAITWPAFTLLEPADPSSLRDIDTLADLQAARSGMV
ncbi:nucleotidyltransferase family protein [Croceicoccus bisphenolivorans]|uniref:nucleotidyltransferase family protein n=1 Tax=Croceicoccus bisphenolivorans TaxID=1783232 RepID=UPI000836A0BE|nr:NTP transferase domain-containing protein [Croceicoccus bisphenolivorans]